MNYHLTRFEINKRCAELVAKDIEIESYMDECYLAYIRRVAPDYCSNPIDTWPIIQKCWNGLNEIVNENGNQPEFGGDEYWTAWQYLIGKHQCTQLEAACIYLIENYGEKE